MIIIEFYFRHFLMFCFSFSFTLVRLKYVVFKRLMYQYIYPTTISNCVYGLWLNQCLLYCRQHKLSVKWLIHRFTSPTCSCTAVGVTNTFLSKYWNTSRYKRYSRNKNSLIEWMNIILFRQASRCKQNLRTYFFYWRVKSPTLLPMIWRAFLQPFWVFWWVD